MKKILEKYDNKVYKKLNYYSQFTIDLIETFYDSLSSKKQDDQLKGTILYTIENALTIMKKDIADYMLLKQLQDEIENYSIKTKQSG